MKEHLAKKEKQLNDLMTIHLGDTAANNGKHQMEAKNSARTLSDIVSINSDFEEMEHIREPNAISLLQHDASSLLPITSSRIKDSHNLGTTAQVIIEVNFFLNSYNFSFIPHTYNLYFHVNRSSTLTLCVHLQCPVSFINDRQGHPNVQMHRPSTTRRKRATRVSSNRWSPTKP